MPDVDLFGRAIEPPSRGPLADRFIVPPFSVLNAREGPWQERKRAWLAMGIQSEVGRGACRGKTDDERNDTAVEAIGGSSGEESERELKRKIKRLAPGGDAMPACDYSKRQRGDGRGRPLGESNV